jgi:hypothetical protein
MSGWVATYTAFNTLSPRSGFGEAALAHPAIARHKAMIAWDPRRDCRLMESEV